MFRHWVRSWGSKRIDIGSLGILVGCKTTMGGWCPFLKCKQGETVWPAIHPLLECPLNSYFSKLLNLPSSCSLQRSLNSSWLWIIQSQFYSPIESLEFLVLKPSVDNWFLWPCTRTLVTAPSQMLKALPTSFFLNLWYWQYLCPWGSGSPFLFLWVQTWGHP